MTDKETLSVYRLKQAEESIQEAQKMLGGGGFSPRSVINRAYYSLFYAVLALFIRAGIVTKTSKHTGVISIFDKEFVKTGKIEKRYSRIMHDIFDARQEGDYRELVELAEEDAAESVALAKDFLDEIKRLIKKT